MTSHDKIIKGGTKAARNGGNMDFMSDSKYSAQTAWNAANTTRVAIKLNNNTDRDIISYLDSLDNKQGYIKELIRADMARKENEK